MTDNTNAADTYQGIYAQTTLITSKQYLPDSVYSSSSITGISLNLVWGAIEPGKGVYDWSVLDHEIQRALVSGKQISLSVTPNHPDSPHWLFAEGAEAHTFKIALHGSVRPQNVTIASPWDPVYQSEYANMMNALAQHLKSIPGAYDAVSVVSISGIGVTTAELKMPYQFNSNAIWQAAGYTPDKVIAAWKSFALATESAFSDKILSVMANDKHAFPLIDNNGNIVTTTSPTYVDVTSQIIADGAQMFGHDFMVTWGGVGSGHLSSAVTLAQQLGAIGGYQTNHFLPSGTGIGGYGSAVAPTEATYQAALESAIINGNVQFLEVWAGDAAKNPQAIADAAALIKQYDASADHTIDSLTVGAQSTAAVHGSTTTITGATTNAGLLVVDTGGDLVTHGLFSNKGTLLVDGASADIDNAAPTASALNFGQMSAQDGGHLHVFDNIVNRAGASITAEQSGVVDMDGSVTNRGMLEADSGAHLNINTAVNNMGGSLVIDDAFMFVKSLTGGGTTTIKDGGTVEFGGSANTNVTFVQGAHGTLVIDQATAFKGHVSGFATGDSFDFTGVNFAGAKLKYMPNTTDPHGGGFLRVQDASNAVVAKIAMTGDFTTANFTAADDGHGHLLVQHHDLLV